VAWQPETRASARSSPVATRWSSTAATTSAGRPVSRAMSAVERH
jgi:hypothetical protein